MKIVLDTNVFISGIFFSGPPYQILNAWRHGRVALVVSAAILDEYQRVGERLAVSHPGIDITPFMRLVAMYGVIVQPPLLAEPVCTDASDDMFIACALAAGCKTIVSGDKHLLQVSGYKGVAVYRPRTFLETFFKGNEPR